MFFLMKQSAVGRKCLTVNPRSLEGVKYTFKPEPYRLFILLWDFSRVVVPGPSSGQTDNPERLPDGHL